MLKDSEAFNSYSADDIPAAKQFYEGTLGLSPGEEMGGLSLKLGGGGSLFIYPKEDHQPAVFTVLNFKVDDVEAAVDALSEKGVSFERYDGMDQDERGIAAAGAGPKVAWFTDPAGNILSVLEG